MAFLGVDNIMYYAKTSERTVSSAFYAFLFLTSTYTVWLIEKPWCTIVSENVLFLRQAHALRLPTALHFCRCPAFGICCPASCEDLAKGRQLL